jgi:hypothetical protein
MAVLGKYAESTSHIMFRPFIVCPPSGSALFLVFHEWRMLYFLCFYFWKARYHAYYSLIVKAVISCFLYLSCKWWDVFRSFKCFFVRILCFTEHTVCLSYKHHSWQHIMNKHHSWQHIMNACGCSCKVSFIFVRFQPKSECTSPKYKI